MAFRKLINMKRLTPMGIRSNIWVLPFLIFICPISVNFPVHAQQNDARPNIIFIFADDWGYGDLSCHGSKFLETPNIDNLAKEGIDFTNFTVNNPVCSPSRTAVMTGQFPARQSIHQHFQGVRAHINRGMPDWLDVEGILLPREFQKAGYATGHFGKWHLGSGEGMPTEDMYGIDEFATFNGSGTNDIPKSSSLAVDYVEKFIKKHKDKPFFVNFWLHETHLNHYPKERFMEQFDYLSDKEQVYASVIAEGDEAVGRIITLLKQLNIDNNTLVIFSSDNGPEWEGFEERHKIKGDGLGKYYSVGKTAGLKGSKRSLFEGGIRVPFIVRWPEVVPQNIIDSTSVITAVDLLPTFLEAAGIEISENYMLDGESALSAFKGEKFIRSKPIFWEWRGGTKNEYTWPTLGVRDGDWKLVVDVSREKMALYNLVNDWGEHENLAESNPEKLKELSLMIEEWKQSLPTKARENCISEERKNL